MKDMHMQNRTADPQKIPVFRTIWASLTTSFCEAKPIYLALWPFVLGFIFVHGALVFYQVPYPALKTGIGLLMFLSFGALISQRYMPVHPIKETIKAFSIRVGSAGLAIAFMASLVILYDAARMLPTLTTDYYFMAVALVITISLLLLFVGLQAAAVSLLIWPALNDMSRPFNIIALWDMAHGKTIRILWVHLLAGIAASIIGYTCLTLVGMGVMGIGFLSIEDFSLETISQLGHVKYFESAVNIPRWFTLLLYVCDSVFAPFIAAFCALVLSSTSAHVYKHLTTQQIDEHAFTKS